jgi:hypothetical protein
MDLKMLGNYLKWCPRGPQDELSSRKMTWLKIVLAGLYPPQGKPKKALKEVSCPDLLSRQWTGMGKLRGGSFSHGFLGEGIKWYSQEGC